MFARTRGRGKCAGGQEGKRDRNMHTPQREWERERVRKRERARDRDNRKRERGEKRETNVLLGQGCAQTPIRLSW